jgi:CRP-like cAMP-binding protein
MTFDAGDVLCAEGADAAECYVIAEGEATVTIGDDVVARVGHDDVVGEKGPIEGRPRAATVTATTHMLTVAISREHLLALMESSPAAAAAMRDLVAERYGAQVST